jgi:ubiquinone/menaquinone biosynthesis C-methylase UbiE
MATRLEARGRHPRFMQPLSAYLEHMNIDGRATVLDLGCGTGVAARAIARRPGFKGTVLGIDLSDKLLQAARRFAADEALGGRVRFETGDSHTLGLADGSFEAVVAHTLFSHLAEPTKVLAEMRRVLRTGGTAAIFDGDYASMTFELADAERSRRMDDAIIGSLVTNPRIMRQLPRMLGSSGFAIDAVLPTIVTEVGVSEFWKSGVEAYARLAPRAGILSADEAARWADELMQASARGEFFGSCVFYAYVMRAI